MIKDIVIFDASFFSRLRMIDEDCILIDFFTDSFAKYCAVDSNQYKKGSCRHAQHNCRYINDLISDNEIFDFYFNYPGSVDIKKVCSINDEKRKGDWVDVKSLALAKKTTGALILSCDSNLLKLCKDLGINHLCFKASLVKLCNYLEDNDIFLSDNFKTSLMFNEQVGDPFLNYYKNTKCNKCNQDIGCGYGLKDLNDYAKVIKHNSKA